LSLKILTVVKSIEIQTLQWQDRDIHCYCGSKQRGMRSLCLGLLWECVPPHPGP